MIFSVLQKEKSPWEGLGEMICLLISITILEAVFKGKRNCLLFSESLCENLTKPDIFIKKEQQLKY